jgi:hypothetical protein
LSHRGLVGVTDRAELCRGKSAHLHNSAKLQGRGGVNSFLEKWGMILVYRF